MIESSHTENVKRLYRSHADRMLAGVCGGMAEYFSIDPVLMRVLWVIITLFGGVGLLLYIAAAIIIPQDNEGGETSIGTNSTTRQHSDKTLFWGALLVIVGMGLILRQFGVFTYFSMMHIPWQLIWAILLILLGLYIMLYRSQQSVDPKPFNDPKSESSSQSNDAAPKDKQIYRSRSNKMIAGVCGGLAEHFNMDPTVMRLIYVLLSTASIGMGLVVYIVLAFVFPERPYEISDNPESEYHS